MKKLLFILVAMATMFTACNKNDVDVNDQKVTVGINLLTESDAGLVVKATNIQGTQSIARVNTPACVKSLTITATAAQGTEQKTFTFDTDLSQDAGNQVANGATSMSMNFWGGSNNVKAHTESYTETASTDPVVSEADGISSNVTYRYANGTSLWGIDQDIVDRFNNFDSNAITATTTLAQDVKHILRSIAPYAEFNATQNDFDVDFTSSNELNLNAKTTNSRMIVTCQFDDGTYDTFLDNESIDIDGDYSATIEPIFQGTVSATGATCPARTIYANNDWIYNNQVVSSQSAWFYWSNEYAKGGEQLGFKIVIKQGNNVVNEITLDDDTELLLEGGKDIWVNIIITDAVVNGSQAINITYNWDNEDRQIVL